MHLIELKPLDESDLNFWLHLRNAPETRAHQPFESVTRDQLWLRLQQYLEQELKPENRYSFKWVARQSGSLTKLGVVAFDITQPEQNLGRIGYSFLPEYWNRGLATRAVRTLVNLVFSEFEIERLEAVCSVDNTASRRVLEKSGFQLEGTLRGYLKIKGVRIDHWVFGLLKADWEATARDREPEGGS